MSLLARLGLAPSPAAADEADDLIGAVRKRLARLSAERAEMVAAFAGLLMRVANADGVVSETEAVALRRLVEERTDLGHEETEVVATLVTGRVEGVAGIEYSRLTRVMNAHATPAEKLQLLDCLYAVATADDLASVAEEEEIRAVARALMLSHVQLIEVRQRYAAQLEVLRGLPR